MGILGRKRKSAPVSRGRHALPEPGDAGYTDDAEDAEPDALDGPFDEADAPDDEVARIDLGSVRVPVPHGAQVQVEMDQSTGNVRAVHVVTPYGQATISAYAAPRSAPLWPAVSAELAESLRAEGGTVRRSVGEWGSELAVVLNDVNLHFAGVDGPRWMLRGVIAGTQDGADRAQEALRELMRQTVVVRGDGPMPVRNPLPITLPDAVAEHIADQRARQ
ncbi:MAG: DUF3710 domain-containing protein, partial [Haloechinothrix sp.]